MAPSIAIRSAAHLSNVLHGRTEAHPAASAAPPTSDSDDEMDASDDAAPAPFTPGGRIQGFNTAGRNAHSRPTPSHILLAVLSGETAGIPPLSSLSVLELTSNRFEQEYPHVTFAHASKELRKSAERGRGDNVMIYTVPENAILQCDWQDAHTTCVAATSAMRKPQNTKRAPIVKHEDQSPHSLTPLPLQPTSLRGCYVRSTRSPPRPPSSSSSVPTASSRSLA